MKVLKALLIEDEPIAAEIIEDYIAQIPFLNLTKHCAHALEATSYLKEQQVDVLFLDLHLPGLKGFDFLRTLSNPPQVIVISAYHQYALEGFELNVVDYLLKPVDFPRFLTAVNKLTIEQGERVVNKHVDKERTIYLSEQRKQVKIFLKDIVFLESQKDYVAVRTANRTITTKSTLGDLINKLPSGEFIRIHRSFVVAKKYIQAFSTTEIDTACGKIPVGRSYKEHVIAQIHA